MTDRAIPSRGRAALAGAAAGAAAIGVNELMAGLFAGAPSFVAEIGGLVIDLQPPGAKQFVVDLFGTADKAVFSLLIVVVAVIGSALLGVVARNRFELATVGFIVAGLAAAAIAILLDPLVNPVLGLLSALASVATAILVLRWLLGLAAPAGDPAVPMAEMPDWSRRRFLGTSLGVVAGAAMLGIVGRFIGQPSATPTVAIPIPDPLSPAPPLPPGSDFGISGLSPIVTPNGDFYRIDTSLLTPQLDVGKLAAHGGGDGRPAPAIHLRAAPGHAAARAVRDHRVRLQRGGRRTWWATPAGAACGSATCWTRPGCRPVRARSWVVPTTDGRAGSRPTG